MKNRLSVVFYLIVVFFLPGCSESASELFTLFVHPDETIAQEVVVGKVKCMHCPAYFRFKMSPADQTVLLKYQSLKKIDEPTSHMESVMTLPDAKWWPRKTEIINSDKYWIEYPRTDPNDVPWFRMAIIKGESVYYMATGGNWILERNK